jgi:hypothetical protein
MKMNEDGSYTVSGSEQYLGQQVKNARDVDQITGDRITKLAGGVNEELRNLRKGIVSLYVLSNRNVFTRTEAEEASRIGVELLEVNRQIEEIVTEGKRFKKAMGWA